MDTGDLDQGPRSTVLIIDDMGYVRDTAKAMLELAKFRVLSAADGRSALKILESAEQVDAVLLDMAMPDLNGVQTFEQIRKIRPSIAVIVISGFWEEDVLNQFSVPKPFGFLQKPFRYSSLVEVVTEAIRQSKPDSSTRSATDA